MKRLVVILFVLCSMLFVTNPILKSAFADNNSKSNNKVTYVNKNNLDETKTNKTLETNDEIKTLVTNEKDDIKDNTVKEVNSSNDINSKDKSNKDLEEIKGSTNANDQIVNTEESTSNEQATKPEEPVSSEQAPTLKSLTKEDALKLLMDMNPNLVYEYQGDENTFQVLKNKGFSGYVFLPNVDTDLGYFVDKNSSSIYHFHPSGYLEKIK